MLKTELNQCLQIFFTPKVEEADFDDEEDLGEKFTIPEFLKELFSLHIDDYEDGEYCIHINDPDQSKMSNFMV
ncbi:MAG: hypothetical protein GF311_06450 [Candidatus Lokiarchaeota archaeon]|nr:hypothetical protein [Candidatus Lokiarchaeota archaeon]